MKLIKLKPSIIALALALSLSFQAMAGATGKGVASAPAVEVFANNVEAAIFNFHSSTVERRGFTLPPLGNEMFAGGRAGNSLFFWTVMQANTTPTTIRCQDATLFRQYSPRHGPHERLGRLSSGERVGWRHNYNGDWAVVLYYRTAQWGFIMRRCLNFAG